MSLEVIAGFAVAALFVYALLVQVRDNRTKNCDECGKRVPYKAKVCPFCGNRFTRPGT